MASFPFAVLKSAIASDAGCGVSLEDTGDNEFMQFVVRAEGLLPETFANFDRGAVNFAAEFDAIKTLLARSIDLRLLVVLAKLSILDRNLDSFAQSLDAIRDCLRTHWDTVHPLPMDGDHVMRLITLQSLDDMAHTVLPLQYTPLFRARRIGFVTYRSQLIATGKIAVAAAAEGEKAVEVPDIRTAVLEAELADILSARASAHLIVSSLVDIEAAYNEGASGETLGMPRLKAIALDLAIFLDECAVSKDPSLSIAAAEDAEADAAGEEGEARPKADKAGFTSTAAAHRALKAALLYFTTHEASSPVRLLLTQAEALIGRSFFEALQVLTPEYANQASVKLGRDLPLTLSIESLSNLLSSDSEVHEMDSANEEADTSEPVVAATRDQALELMQRVGVFFKSKEPSSPIPMLLEQARSVAGRDFVNLLREILPNNAFRIDE